MKLHVLSENLQKKLGYVGRAVSQRNQMPILLNFLLEAKDGKLEVSGTDLEIGIKTEIPANIEEKGGITVPSKLFIELVNSLPQGKISLNKKDQTLEVVTPKIKSSFQTIPKDEFPELFKEKGQKIMTFKKDDLRKKLTPVVFAASSDLGRANLSGVLFKTEGKELVIVATDGYRLSLKKEQFETKEKEVKKILIPARVIREAILLKEEGEDIDVYMAKENNQIILSTKNTVLVGRLIEADFPNFERIIPQDFSTRVFFDREELLKAVKIASIFSRETANIIKLSLKKDTIVVSANMPSVGDNTIDVEAKLEGEENEIAFNAKYLLEFLGSIEENDLVFEMTGPLNPGVFKIKGDDSFLHLIMPIRVQE